MKGAMMFFVCGQKKERCHLAACTLPSSGGCEQALVGPKAGQLCGRQSCSKHAIEVGGKKLCPGHARQLSKKERD